MVSQPSLIGRVGNGCLGGGLSDSCVPPFAVLSAAPLPRTLPQGCRLGRGCQVCFLGRSQPGCSHLLFSTSRHVTHEPMPGSCLVGGPNHPFPPPQSPHPILLLPGSQLKEDRATGRLFGSMAFPAHGGGQRTGRSCRVWPPSPGTLLGEEAPARPQQGCQWLADVGMWLP